MADYYPLIARAVEGLSEQTSDKRHAVYERARTALIAQLRSLNPPLSEAEIQNESRSLDEAIARVEADHAPAGFDADAFAAGLTDQPRSEEHTSELQSRQYLVCRLLLEKKKKQSQ